MDRQRDIPDVEPDANAGIRAYRAASAHPTVRPDDAWMGHPVAGGAADGPAAPSVPWSLLRLMRIRDPSWMA